MDNTRSNDEFVKDGLISKPASAIANAANALSMIPMIAPYAKATAMVATKIGQVAKVFGYSRPQVLEDTKPYVPRYMGNLSNTDTSEPLVKLSADSKNELTIDTRVMGLGGEDELAIAAIAQRPSFWQQFDWAESATADTLLASMLVTPLLARLLPASPAVEIHPTALSFAAHPFDAWQGSIKFRFNIVCSEYHRGRLRIVYNPRSNNAGPVAYNQVYSTTIDISEDRDFEYEVKWADIRAWNELGGAEFPAALNTFSTFANVSAGTPYDNGTLSVYVVNELATPSNTAAAVKVQVWVSGGEDIAFAVPSVEGLKRVSYFREQSDIAPYVAQSEEAPDALATSADQSNAPHCSNGIETFGTSSDMIKEDNQYLVYQGERIVSFRELLRRYHYHSSYWPGTVGTGTRMVSVDLTDFPYYRGWDPNGGDNGSTFNGSSPYNFCNMTLLNYLTPAFAFRRGGLRHKAILTGKHHGRQSSSLGVGRHDLSGTVNDMSARQLDSDKPGDRRIQMLNTLRGSLGGTALTPTFNNPCLEYETPFYTAGQRFIPARNIDYYQGDPQMGHELTTEFHSTDNSISMRIDKYISTAEDFQLGLFVGAPVYYVYDNPTAEYGPPVFPEPPIPPQPPTQIS